MGVSLKVTTPRWLRPTLPRLQTLFHRLQNNEGKFPLMKPHHQKKAFQLTPKSMREAAILVPIVLHGEEPSLFLTKRSSTVTTHKSEISFPGGHREIGGETLIETALREAQEECPSPLWSSTIVIGECTVIPSIKGTPVTPVIGVVPEPISDLQSRFSQSDEVERFFVVPLTELLRTETSKTLTRIDSPAPVYPSQHGDIWGLTAFVIRPILHRLLKPVFVDSTTASKL